MLGTINRADKIEAISFDGTGTLWRIDRMIEQSVRYALEELRRVDPEAAARLSVEKMMETRRSVAAESKEKPANVSAVGLEALRRTLRDVGKTDDALAQHLNQISAKQRAVAGELFDDAMPVLKTLQKKYTIGVVSNGRDYPENTGLREMCQFAVFSQSYTYEKPDPRIFHIALHAAGCGRGRLLHVGDSLVNDITGARNAGIRSVWLNRPGEPNSSGITADHEIRSLWELLNIV